MRAADSAGRCERTSADDPGRRIRSYAIRLCARIVCIRRVCSRKSSESSAEQDVVRIVAGTLGSVDNAIFPQNVLSVRRLRSPIINSINSIFIISHIHQPHISVFSSVKVPPRRERQKFRQLRFSTHVSILQTARVNPAGRKKFTSKREPARNTHPSINRAYRTYRVFAGRVRRPCVCKRLSTTSSIASDK